MFYRADYFTHLLSLAVMMIFLGLCSLNMNLRMKMKFLLSVCSRQPRRRTPFVRYFRYSLHCCLLSHIVSCVRKVKQTRQIAVNSNSRVVEILRDVVNHERTTSAQPLLGLLFVAFEPHHVGLFLKTAGLFYVPS